MQIIRDFTNVALDVTTGRAIILLHKNETPEEAKMRCGLILSSGEHICYVEGRDIINRFGEIVARLDESGEAIITLKQPYERK